MPEKNGYEAVSIIKNDPVLKDIPIIAISADIYEDIYRKCINTGIDYVLSKPYTKQKLIEIINKIKFKNHNNEFFNKF